MVIERWSPFAEMRRIDGLFNRVWRGYPAGPVGAKATGTGAWSIPIDVVREGDDLVVRASLPGVSMEQIDVTVEENVVTIKAQVEVSSEAGEKEFLLRERRAGSFRRAVQLPETADSESARTSYGDGVLEIRFPVKEISRARKLEVSAA